MELLDPHTSTCKESLTNYVTQKTTFSNLLPPTCHKFSKEHNKIFYLDCHKIFNPPSPLKSDVIYELLIRSFRSKIQFWTSYMTQNFFRGYKFIYFLYSWFFKLVPNANGM